MDNRIGFGTRLGAFLLDLVFTLMATYIVVKLFESTFESMVNFNKFEEQQLNLLSSNDSLWFFTVLLPIGAVIIGFIYNIIEGITGQTPGKMLLKIRIYNQDGTNADTNKLMIRFILKNIGSIAGIISLVISYKSIDITGQLLGIIIFIGCFFVLGESKLALHDMIAKTAVYKTVKEEPQQE